MTELFLDIVNMSISAGWLVLVVLALRVILKKAPKWVIVLLWGIVAVRLICPFSIESRFSLMPESLSSGALVNEWADDYIGHNHFISEDSVYYDDAIDAGREPISDGEGGHYVAAGADRISEPSTVRNKVVPKLAVLWGIGISLMAAYALVSYLSLRHKLRSAVILRDNIFQCEAVSSPFVFGILKPKIYLPYAMDGNNLNHVVAHEQAHIKRKDHWWKPLGFLLLTVYWFNPLMWLAYILLCRDIELACDEKVIAELGNEQRADYTQALVACAVKRRMIAACPLAFGEVGVKERVKSVMNYKKPAFWIIVLAVIACVVVAICFLTNPVSKEPDLSFLNYENAISLIADVDEVMAIYCPSSDDGSGGSIQVGAATGTDLAKQLDRWDWKECSAPRQTLSSPGSVEFIIEDDYRITVHQRKSGSLRQYAVIKYQDDIRYYSIDKSDYPDAVALVHTPKNANEREAIGKTYLYEKEGSMGHFQITLYDDGTFTYYEGLASSYLGTGTWNQDGNIITLSDDETVGYALVNHFNFDGDSLVFIEKDSSNFIYVKVANGERFNLTGEAFKPNNSDETNSTTNETWDLIPMVMVNGTLYLDTGHESTIEARCGVMDGEITSQVDGSKQPTVDDQSNFGTGYGYQYGATEGTIEIFMNGKWWIFASEEARQVIQFPATETGFCVNFAGNTSLQQKFVLTDDRPYWCILVENHGTEKISTEVGGEVRKIEPGTFDKIFSDEKGKPGTYSVSFATSGSSGMTGNAVCYTYKYRIEITGRLHNAVKDTTYILLTNIEGITFEQAWKASGLSSNMDDYFDPADAVFIGIR